jgi:WD40 repeat protein
LEDTLAEAERAEIAAHLEACAGCQVEMERLFPETPAPPAGADPEPRTEFWRRLRQYRPPITDEEPPEGSSAASPALPDVPGYDLLGVLGQGGMGVVYKAWQCGLNRTVALKVVLGGGHASAADLARFRAEAEAVARLQHPNIVQVYEVGEHRGLPFLSLEFCPGGSLAEQIDGTPLEPFRAAELVAVLARAIHHAHQNGVVHRDLKPANVLLASGGPEGRPAVKTARPSGPPPDVAIPKIADFGLARRLDVTGPTVTGVVMGTPSYMAPEQAQGHTHAVGPATDVYALGATLYECLTGRPPFKGPTPLDTLLLVVSEDVVPPRRLQPGVPRDLETICLKCLEKDPARRYAGAEELADDLRRFLAGEPTRARPVGTAERLLKWMKRRPAAAALAVVSAAALLALLGGGSGFTLALDGARRRAIDLAADEARARASAEAARDLAERRRVQAEWLLYARNTDLAMREWEDGRSHLTRQLLDACSEDFRGWEHAYLDTLLHSNQRTLAGRHREVRAVVFSRDGARVAGGGADGTVGIWDVATGEEVRLLEGHSPVSGVALSPDGRLLAAGTEAAAIIWDVAAGRPIRSLAGLTHGVAFSPDGRLLACAREDRTIKLWDVTADREYRTLRGHTDSVRSVAFSPDGLLLASASYDKAVTVWEAASGRLARTLKGHAEAVMKVAFSPDGQRLASGSLDRTVKLWDARTGRETRTLTGFAATVKGLAFSPDGKRLAATGYEPVIRIWDADTGLIATALRGPAAHLVDVAFSPDGKRLVTPGGSAVTLWNATTRQGPRTFPGHTALVYAVAFSPDGGRLASTGWDGTTLVRDARTGEVVHTLALGAGGLHSVSLSYSPDGSRIAAGRGDGTIQVWDADTGRLVLTLAGHTSAVTSLSFCADGSRLASGGDSRDATICVWDATKGQELCRLKWQNVSVAAVALTPDGRRLIGASLHPAPAPGIKVWDAVTGQEVLAVPGFAPVALSPDGRRLAGMARSGGARVWDAATGQQLLSLEGAGLRLCFTPDGKRLAAFTEPDTILFWGATTGLHTFTLRAGGSDLIALAFAPDGSRLAAGRFDGTVTVWDATGARSEKRR